MRPISEATARIAGMNFSRKYIALGRIVNSWSEIVGVELAAKAQPVRIRYNRKHKRTTKPEAALDIAVSNADATALHYQKGLILERINQVFGDWWITDIKFVTMPVGTAPKKARKAKTPLTEAEKNSLSHVLAAVNDIEIRNRLEALGESILLESKS